MTAGDYKIMRNASNTDTIPDAGSDLLLLWDTAVANVGTGITYSAGTFTLGETGHFLVLCSDQCGTTDTTNNERLNWKTTFTLAGTELDEGFSTGYIRKNSGSQEHVTFSAAIINVSTTTGTGDELQVRSERIDNSTTGTQNRVADRSGITILKLDDTWDYGRYEGSAVTATANNAAVSVLDATVEEDATFTRTGVNVDMATNNLVLAVYSIKSTEVNPVSRSEYQGRVTQGGTPVPGSYSQTYIRDTDNSDWGGYSNVCLLDVTSGDDAALEVVSREHGGEDFLGCTMQLVELPAGAEAIIVEATTGDFNTAATDFAWDTNPYIDTAAFTHSTGNTNLDVDNAGDYLAMASQAVLTYEAVTRAVPSAHFRVNTTNDQTAGAAAYNRGTGTAGFAALATATLLTGLSANDSVYFRNDRIGTASGSLVNESGGISIVRISSLFPPADPTITDVETDEDFRDKDTLITLTGTNYEAAQGTGKVELGSHSTYTASTTKTTQTVTSWADTSIDITVDIGTQTPGGLWMYVTNDTGGTNETGFAVTVHRAVMVKMSASSFITASGEAISSARITGGTGSFTTGRVWDDENGTDAIDLASNNHSEVAWAIKGTTDAEGEQIEFRIVKSDDSLLDTYTNTAKITFAAAGSETQAVAGTMTSAGALTMEVQKGLAGAATSAGVTTKQAQKPLEGYLIPHDLDLTTTEWMFTFDNDTVTNYGTEAIVTETISTFVDGLSGRGFRDTEAVTEQLQLDMPAGFASGGDTTIMFRFKSNQVDASYRTWFSWMNYGTSGLVISQDGTNSRLYLRIDSSGGANQSIYGGPMGHVSDDEWHTIGWVVRSDGTGSLYLDGEFEVDDTYTLGTGFHLAGTDPWFSPDLGVVSSQVDFDFLMITDQALTLAQMRDIDSVGQLTKEPQKPLTGSISSAGTLARKPSKVLAGAVTSAGVLVKQAQLAFTGAMSSAGALATSFLKMLSLSGGMTFGSTLVKETQTTLSGSLTSSGVLGTVSAFVRSLTGSVTSAGSLVKQTQKPLTGAVTSAGTLVRQISRALTGTVSSAGALVKQAQKSLVGQLGDQHTINADDTGGANDIGGWYNPIGADTWEESSSEAHSGTLSFHYLEDGTTADHYIATTTGIGHSPIKSGATFTLEFWVKHTGSPVGRVTNSEGWMGLQAYDDGWTASEWIAYIGTNELTIESDWTKHTITGTATADYDNIRVSLRPGEDYDDSLNPMDTYYDDIVVIGPLSGTLLNKAGKKLAGAVTSAATLATNYIAGLVQQAIAGTMSLAGSLVMKVQRSLTGSASSSGVLTNQAQKVVAGTVTPDATLARGTSTSMSGGMSSAGTLLNRAKVLLGGSLVPSGVQSSVRSAVLALTGAVTSAGAITKGVSTSVLGAISSAGSMLKKPGISSSGSVSSSATLSRKVGKVVDGTITPTNTLIKGVSTTLSGVVTFAGTLATLSAEFLAVVGTVTMAGLLKVKVFTSKVGSLASSGGITKEAQISTEGTITPEATISTIKLKLLSLVGAITPSGVLQNLTGRAVTGSVSSSSTLSRKTSHPLSGSLSSSGAVSTSGTFRRAMAGAMTWAGALVKKARKTTTGTTSSTGQVTKKVSASLDGTLSPSGTESNASTLHRAFTGAVTFAGTLSTVVTEFLYRASRYFQHRIEIEAGTEVVSLDQSEIDVLVSYEHEVVAEDTSGEQITASQEITHEI